MTTAPIGVFDSGLGGLTVVRALVARLPKESIIYVGDTARVPYGPKSPETVRRYAKEIATYLGRAVRTVQQWERSEKLPVHRLQHSKYGSVYAFRSELISGAPNAQPCRV